MNIKHIGMLVMACSISYIQTGCFGPDLNAEAEELLQKCVTETYEEHGLLKHISLQSISECVVVKESGNAYSGMAKVKFVAKKRHDGVFPSVVTNWKFKLVYDGENIMLQDGEMEDVSYEKFQETFSYLDFE